MHIILRTAGVVQACQKGFNFCDLLFFFVT